MTELNIDFLSLGQWLKKDIVNSCSNDNNKSILMQPLSGCCNLYPSKKIMNLSRIKFHRWLNYDVNIAFVVIYSLFCKSNFIGI